MKINIKPMAYAIVSQSGVCDYATVEKSDADAIAMLSFIEERVEPLHPESLVIELSEALKDLLYWDNGKSEYVAARALLAKIMGGSET